MLHLTRPQAILSFACNIEKLGVVCGQGKYHYRGYNFVAHRKEKLDNEVVYEEPDLHLDTHPPRRDPTIELKQCPAYETAKFKGEVDVNVELESCPAYMTVK